MSTEDFQLTSDGVKYSPVTIGEHDDRQSIEAYEQDNGIRLYENSPKVKVTPRRGSREKVWGQCPLPQIQVLEWGAPKGVGMAGVS